MIKRLPPGHPITANAVGGAFVLPTSCSRCRLAAHESWALPSRPETWVALLFLVVFGTVLLFPLALFIIGRWTASGYSYTDLFKPLAAVALAAVILGESIRLTFLLGGALVLVGLWLGALSARSGSSAASVVTEAEPNVVRVPVIADDAALDTAETGLSPQV